jgi:hypothetical protein
MAGPEPCNGLFEERYHEELCTERWERREPDGRLVKDYHSIVATREAATAWEDRFVEYAPKNARELAQTCGPSLLASSADARTAAKQYWTLLRSMIDETNSDYLERQLRQRLGEDEAREADRLADAAVHRNSLLSAYQAAALTVVLFGKEVEGSDALFKGQKVADNPALAWRLYLLTDLLLRDMSIPASAKAWWYLPSGSRA